MVNQADLDLHRQRYLAAVSEAGLAHTDYNLSLPDQLNHSLAMVELLSKKGFTATLDKTGSTIVDITWPEQQQDFILLDKIAILILSSLALSDKKYRDQILPRIVALIEAESINSHPNNFFARLDDETIPVSQAHQGVTPFQHTLDVASEIKTKPLRPSQKDDELSEEQENAIFAARFQVFMHDWGKLFIAAGDVYQYHAELSYFLFKKYVDSRVELQVFKADQADNLLQPIRYHHIFELVSKGVFTLEEVQALFVTDTHAYVLLGVLATADASSIQGYEEYAVEGMLNFMKGIELQVETVLEVLPNMAIAIVKWLNKLLERVNLNLDELELAGEADKKQRIVTSLDHQIERLQQNQAFMAAIDDVQPAALKAWLEPKVAA